jgi:membrane protein YdbS with pleckstrin-like domain
MKDLPQQRLNPKVKNVWRLNDGGWITIVFLAVFVSLYLISSDPTSGLNATFPLQCSVVVYILLMIIWVVILPPIRYARWHYELNEDFLDIEKGHHLARTKRYSLYSRSEYRYASGTTAPFIQPYERNGFDSRWTS